jgi:hypothetical protein
VTLRADIEENPMVGRLRRKSLREVLENLPPVLEPVKICANRHADADEAAPLFGG